MAQISTVLVPALVIQLNNTVLGWDGGTTVYGQILNVPCRNAFIDDSNNYWVVPIKNSGIFSAIDFVPAVGDYETTPPTFDSQPVFRVRDKLSAQTWWVYGTWQQFINSCATCCGDAAVPMPGTDGSFEWQISPCQTICDRNSAGNLFAIFALPSLGAGQTYYPFGSFNNIQLPAASGAGYATTGALLAFLNGSWGSVGSPADTSFVWTISGGTTLIATGGAEEDELCVTVVVV